MGAWLLFMEGSDDLDCVHSNYIWKEEYSQESEMVLGFHVGA
jgi:hypothetical protein